MLKEQTRVAKRKAAKQAIDLGSKAIEKKYGVKGKNIEIYSKSVNSSLDTNTHVYKILKEYKS